MNRSAHSRRAILTIVGATGSRGQAKAQQQATGYPTRLVTIVVPFAPGGTIHFFARFMAARLARLLNQPFLIENRPGLGGVVATCAVAEAAADGHTLLLAGNATFAVGVNITPCRTDFRQAFAPIGLLARSAQVLVATVQSGFRTVDELVAAARAAPGAIRYTTTLSYNLIALAFAEKFEISLASLPASGPIATLDTMARGEAQFAFLYLGDALPQLLAGRTRALAVTTSERIPEMPEVPTLAEAGMQGFSATSDLALFAPMGTPQAILDRLSDASIAVLRQNDTPAMLAPVGIEPIAMPRNEFPAYYEAENQKWLTLIRQFNIRGRERLR